MIDKEHTSEITNKLNLADEYLRQAKCEAIKEFANKINKEIEEALENNHRVKLERLQSLFKRGIAYDDEFVCNLNGKMWALQGIRDFIEELCEEMCK